MLPSWRLITSNSTTSTRRAPSAGGNASEARRRRWDVVDFLSIGPVTTSLTQSATRSRYRNLNGSGSPRDWRTAEVAGAGTLVGPAEHVAQELDPVELVDSQGAVDVVALRNVDERQWAQIVRE